MDVTHLLDKSVPLLRKRLEKRIEQLEISLNSIKTPPVGEEVDTTSAEFLLRLATIEDRCSELEKQLKAANKTNETLSASLKTLSKGVERIG